MNPNLDTPQDSIPIGSIQWDSSWPELASLDERNEILGFVEERFGISADIFDPYLLFKRKKGWWLLRRTAHLVEASKLKVQWAGIKAFHRVGAFIKPTTRMVQCFGHLARRGVVDVSREELKKLTSGKSLAMEVPLDDGYVLLRLDGMGVVGIGLWVKGRLISQIPKKELRMAMFLTGRGDQVKDQYKKAQASGIRR